MKKRDIAIFIAGLTAWESVVHFSFYLCDMLPLRFCNITLGGFANSVQIVLPAMVSFFCLRYAWKRRAPGDK